MHNLTEGSTMLLNDHYNRNLRLYGFYIGQVIQNFTITGYYCEDDGEFRYVVLCSCGSNERGIAPHTLVNKTTGACHCNRSDIQFIKPHHKVLRKSDLVIQDPKKTIENNSKENELYQDGDCILFADDSENLFSVTYRKIVTVNEGFFRNNNINDKLNPDNYTIYNKEKLHSLGWVNKDSVDKNEAGEELVNKLEYGYLMRYINNTWNPIITCKNINEKFKIRDVFELPKSKYDSAVEEIQKYTKTK